MKITLPVKQLKDFFDLSKFVKTEKSDINPILKYLKIEIEFNTCFITKSNSEAFCKYNFGIEHDDVSFLIEEEKLLTLISLTKKDKITIQEQNGQIIISDSYIKYKCSNHTYILTDYKSIPEFDKSQGYLISKELINKLKIAKNFIGTDKLIMPYFCFVYYKDNVLYSSTSQIFYIDELKTSLQKAYFTETECNFLSQYDNVNYCQLENYNIYKIGSLVCGFIQLHGANFFDTSSFSQRITKSNYASLKIEDIINFCESTIKFAKDGFNTSSVEFSNSNAKFVFIDKDKGEENIIEVDSSLSGNPFVFHFNPYQLLNVVKNLPYERINIGDENGCVSVWNDNDVKYFSLISKIVV